MENENQRGPRFHTFYSNSFEVLEKIFFQMAERDRKNLAKDQNGSAFPGLFTPITVIVPSRAVGNRLSRGYASGSGEGISAGFNFELRGEWLTPFLGAQVGSLAQTPELEWLVWNRLLEDDFLNDPRSENVRHYLTDPLTGNPRAEDDTARMIAERLANISVAENIESALEAVRESLGITLSQKQEQAVRTAFQHGLTIITGSPGTGKTTVLKAIIEVFKNLHPKGKFALMAPTGRASRRMAESTGVDEARTLHSALGLGTGEEVGDGERVRFVDADLVIVDEFSMVDMWLAQQFFKRIGQHTRVVLVGDPNQLPSVGAGNVFYELIHSGMVPVTVLDWIFRQSKDGLIAYNAKFINEGSTKLYYGNDFVFVDSPTQIETARRIQDIYCKEAAERGIENVQILSPFREKGEAASEQLNRAIRERVNPFRSAEEEVKIGSRIFRVHDRVMQTKNTEKVSNGDLGFITGITTNSKGERLVQMDFGGDRKLTYTTEQLAHVDLAYATTIHKAMGSEFETVIIPIVKAHTIMLYRNLLYTAVTRAKKKVILVGHKPILFMAVHRADISKRNTMLGERIHLYCKAYHTERNALPELQQAG